MKYTEPLPPSNAEEELSIVKVPELNADASIRYAILLEIEMSDLLSTTLLLYPEGIVIATGVEYWAWRENGDAVSKAMRERKKQAGRWSFIAKKETFTLSLYAGNAEMQA